MKFFAEGSIGLFDVSFRGRFIDVQELVVIFGTQDKRNDTEEDDDWDVAHFATRGGRFLVAPVKSTIVETKSSTSVVLSTNDG